MTQLWELEEALYAQGARLICGVDEAGRGPLAGPVCAAAVILPRGLEIEGLNDSKKLSEKKREELFELIKEKALYYGIAFAEVSEIEELNILNATFLAMRRAVEHLSEKPEIALVDGNRDPGLGIRTELVVKGDSRCADIAAASILAKVTRDRYMLRMDELYPQYHFVKHKGYGTKLHYEALREHGPSPIHRLSFLRKMH